MKAPSAGVAGGAGKAFNLPDPGEGLTEATITTWRVKEGDAVKVNDIIVEIETAKSLVELPSPWTGKIVKILAAEGEEVAVGSPIVMIDDGTAPAAVAAPVAPSADTTTESGGANLVGYGSKEGGTARRARRGREPQAATPAVNASFASPNVPAVQATSHVDTVNRPLAKPPVRKLAKDLGIDLAQVVGTGAAGVVTRDDVQQFAAGGAAVAAPVAAPVAAAVAPAAMATTRVALEDRREPIKGVRKVTAKAMVDSAFTKPHVTEWVEIDVTGTMELVERLKARREFRGGKVSPMLIYAKACTIAMKRQPSINSSWDEAAQEIVYHGDVNLGIAAATPRGLMVPNIKGAQAMDLQQLNDAINGIVTVAKEGKLQPADYSGGTFTITNVGPFGMDAGTPIINGNESAILAMGQITRKPWVVGTGAAERIEPRWVATLALSFDHRLIDGEQGSKFLRDVADILVDPAVALMF
ncbi:MAG: dihydrolipoamide acetyltransferase family protein [Propionibacteriaceae bacterium]